MLSSIKNFNIGDSTNHMENSFKLTHINDNKIILDISKHIKEAVEEGAEKRNIPNLFKICDILLTSTSIWIESTGKCKFEEQDKKHLLNILKKIEYLNKLEEDTKLMKCISEIRENVLKEEYNENLQIEKIYEAFKEFTTSVRYKIPMDYIILQSKFCKNSMSKRDPTEHVLLIQHAKNSRDFKKSLEIISNWIDGYFYKNFFGYSIEKKHIPFKHITLYSIDSLYTESYRPDRENPMFLIDYAARLFFEKDNGIERMQADFENNKLENPNTPFTPGAFLYDLTEEDLKVIASVFYHRSRVIDEINLYCYFFRLFESIFNNWSDFLIDPKSLPGLRIVHWPYLINKCKKKMEELENKRLDNHKKYKPLQKEARKMRRDSIKIPNKLKEKKRIAIKEIIISTFTHSMEEKYYNYWKVYNERKAEIDQLNPCQINYIECHLSKVFKMQNIDKKPLSSSLKLGIFLISLAIAFAIIFILIKFRISI